MDPDVLSKLIIALLLVLLNGFSAAEFSIVKVRYSQIQISFCQKETKWQNSRTNHQNLDAYLSATQLGLH